MLYKKRSRLKIKNRTKSGIMFQEINKEKKKTHLFQISLRKAKA